MSRGEERDENAHNGKNWSSKGRDDVTQYHGSLCTVCCVPYALIHHIPLSSANQLLYYVRDQEENDTFRISLTIRKTQRMINRNWNGRVGKAICPGGVGGME